MVRYVLAEFRQQCGQREGEDRAETGATILLATDFFLHGYAAAEEGDLRSIRYVIAGGERVKDETRRLWARTGITILEGYGATECMISCNLPDRNRPGTVGPFLPGIAWKLEPVEGIHEGPGFA